MMWFWIRIVVWFSLHKPVRTFKSSCKSVFKSPGYRIHSEHQSESPTTGPNLTKRVRNVVPRNQTHREGGELTYTHNALTHVPIHARYTYIHTRLHPRTYIDTHTHTHTHTHEYTHIYIHIIYTYPYLHNTPHNIHI